MSLAEIILALQSQLEALKAIQDSQKQFTQSDLDAAVKAAVDPLLAQMVLLQTKVGDIPKQIHDAVLAEDVALAGKLKPLVDQVVQAVAALVVV